MQAGSSGTRSSVVSSTYKGRAPWSGGIEGVVVNLSDVLELVASG
jgi:hypothetical protein